nr:hypothetical protein [Tanacetum cinerariifolium]
MLQKSRAMTSTSDDCLFLAAEGLAICYLATKQYALAGVQCTRLAALLKTKINSESQQRQQKGHLILGKYYLATQQYAKARAQLTESLAINKELGNRGAQRSSAGTKAARAGSPAGRNQPQKSRVGAGCQRERPVAGRATRAAGGKGLDAEGNPPPLTYLVESFDRQRSVDTQLDLAPVELETTLATPLGLIINEAVTNALKHAFPPPRRGTLHISLVILAPQQYQLSITDDGVGLPPGFDLKRSRSLGMVIIKGLSRQLDGQLAVSSADGVCVNLQFDTRKKPAYAEEVA